jgi:hypothetical protein
MEVSAMKRLSALKDFWAFRVIGGFAFALHSAGAA